MLVEYVFIYTDVSESFSYCMLIMYSKHMQCAVIEFLTKAWQAVWHPQRATECLRRWCHWQEKCGQMDKEVKEGKTSTEDKSCCTPEISQRIENLRSMIGQMYRLWYKVCRAGPLNRRRLTLPTCVISMSVNIKMMPTFPHFHYRPHNYVVIKVQKCYLKLKALSIYIAISLTSCLAQQIRDTDWGINWAKEYMHHVPMHLVCIIICAEYSLSGDRQITCSFINAASKI